MKTSKNSKLKNKPLVKSAKKLPAAVKGPVKAREVEVASAVINYLVELRAELAYAGEQNELVTYRDIARHAGLNAATQTVEHILDVLQSLDFADFDSTKEALDDLGPCGMVHNTVASIVDALDCGV